ncbi:hypothetical protein [Massilioclostridium coli]|uniref:hypothetical protein n=1 Tax=Massilioclostridium coli TaxID=1870991 RepID=UPI00085BFE83|nr:hypothetical protein [Massilioclostridium coli]
MNRKMDMIKKEWYLIGGICLAVGAIIGFLAGRLSYHKPKQLQQDSCDCSCDCCSPEDFEEINWDEVDEESYY